MEETVEKPGMRDKLMEPMQAIVERKRAELMPLLQGGAGGAQAALRNDECVRKVAQFCYPLLPGLVRLAVKEPTFVDFVLNNREKLLARLAGPA